MKHSFSLICFLILYVYTSFAQSPSMRQLGLENGMPSLTVYQILQDDKGYIWMGTQNGICRYDGREFKIWEMNDLMDKEILYLSQDAFGNIWFRNLSMQVGRVEGETVEIVFDNIVDTEKERITAFEITGSKILLAKKNLINPKEYITTEHTINQSGDISQKKIYNGTSDRNFENIIIHKEEIFLKKIELSNSEEERIGIKNGIITKYISTSKNEFSKGNIISAEIQLISSSGMSVYTDISKVYISDERGFRLLKDFKTVPIRKCRLFSDDLWILTTSGTFVYDVKTGKEKSSFLSGIACNNVIKDRENNFWITTSESGVFILPNFEFSIYKSEDGLQKKEDVNSLLQSRDKTLYIGTSSGEITCFNLKTDKINSLKTGYEGRVTSIAEDSLGIIWVGQDKRLSFFIKSDDSPRTINDLGGIKKVLIGSENRIFTAFSHGVNYFTVSYKNDIPEIVSRKLIFQKRTYGLAEDNAGSIWIGSVEGLYLFKNDQVAPFLENGEHIKYKVSSIFQDPENATWISTSDQGILKIMDGKVVRRLNTDNGLISNNCTAVFKSNDLVLIGTDKGLVIYNEFNASFKIINDKSGLPANAIRTIFMDDENIWVGTSRGLAQIPVAAIQPNTTKPPVYLTKISISGKDTVIQPSYNLKFNENQLDIGFTGIALKSGGKERYKYRLQGLNDTWRSTGLRSARYHGLPSGSYKFEVLALNEEGIESLQPAEFSFVIATPWWKTAWFYISTVLGAMILTGGLVYWRQNERRKIEVAENDLREKIRALSLEALQNQMNPHFIFNALNAIQDFFINKDHKAALFYLSKFAQMIRWIFDYSKSKAIPLSDEIEFLNLYLEIEKLRFGDRIDIDFQIDENLNSLNEEFQLPPLLIQPILENSFKHGLMHKRDKGKLSIQFKISDQGLFHCRVYDNGIGRNKAKELSAWRIGEKKLGSLKVIKERLQIFHNAQLSDKKYLKISDLTDASGNSCGTIVDIFIYKNKTNTYAA